MRLAILQQAFGRFGGAEKLALAHFHQLRKMNVDATFFYDGWFPRDSVDRLDGLDIRGIPSGLPAPTNLKAILDFVKQLRQFDRILIHHHVEPILAYFVSKLFGSSTIWYSGGGPFELVWEEYITGRKYREVSTTLEKTSNHFYGRVVSRFLLSDRFYGTTTRIAQVVDIKTVRNFSKIIANSKYTARLLTNIYGLTEAPLVVYPGADPVLTDLASANGHRESDYMLSVGALIPQKNLDTVIRAASTVPASKLAFVGNGREIENLRNLAGRLHVGLRIVNNATVNELADNYSRCQFLVHMALYEPFGLTPIEAALFSKPSIVTNRGGPSETVIDGETGFVVDPTSTRKMGKLMQFLLNEDKLRHEMGQKARRFTTRTFTIEKSTQDLLTVIEN